MIKIILPLLLLVLGISVMSAERELPINFESLKALAEKGDARAQLNLGYMYQIGEDPIVGGPQEDYKEAVKWFRKAAQQGVARAQHTLGLMHYLGQGAKQDQMLAYAWVSVSVLNGYETVKTTKRLLARAMTSDRIARAEVLAQEMIKDNPELIKK